MRADGARLPLARKEQLLVRELAEEVLLFDLKRKRALCLNRSSALVWKHCDGKTTVTSMASVLSQEFSAPVDEAVVWLALRQIADFDLLEKRRQLASPHKDLSRRRLVRHLGVAAVLLPVIVAISAPRAVSAASCLPLGSSCTSSTQCCSNCCSEDVVGSTCQATAVCNPPKPQPTA